MDNEITTLTKDIAKADHEIKTFIHGIDSLAEFQKDLKIKRAVERNVLVIGRAMRRILKRDPSIHLDDAREFIAVSKEIKKDREETYDQTLWGLIRRRT